MNGQAVVVLAVNVKGPDGWRRFDRAQVRQLAPDIVTVEDETGMRSYSGCPMMVEHEPPSGLVVPQGAGVLRPA